MSGFYKLDNDILLHGPNYVLNKEYTLRREQKDNYTFPVDGWYWFNTREEAKTFFNIED